MTAAAFAAVFAALYAAHEVGDHWIQTGPQACGKGGRGWAGRLLCARHTATLTAAKVVALTALARVTGLHLHPVPVAAALVVDAVSHYWADRRTTLARLATLLGETLIPGKGEFFRFGAPRPGMDDAPHLGTGAYHLDQSWHIGWLFIAALIASAGV